jgi:hypothetical protein
MDAASSAPSLNDLVTQVGANGALAAGLVLVLVIPLVIKEYLGGKLAVISIVIGLILIGEFGFTRLSRDYHTRITPFMLSINHDALPSGVFARIPNNPTKPYIQISDDRRSTSILFLLETTPSCVIVSLPSSQANGPDRLLLIRDFVAEDMHADRRTRVYQGPAGFVAVRERGPLGGNTRPVVMTGDTGSC